MSDPSLLPQALRLVKRELRGGLRGFGVFLTCLFLGVFSISAIGSFTESAKSGLLADASALLGGDFEVRLAHRQLPSEAMDFLSARGELSHITTMRTMVANTTVTDTIVADTKVSRSVLSELKAVDTTYPLYGHLDIDPQQSVHEALDGNNKYSALVEQPLLTRLNVNIGDLVKVGSAEFRIRGIITTEPDRSLRAFNLGPRFMISHAGLTATGLVQPGSMVYHRYRLRLPDPATVDQLK
ncbi:MAG: ABC transporter permease, partial [Deltaproteobacteria bacterium]|nr:ABC transporter permease [Deltaproteobacteria bacterium]